MLIHILVTDIRSIMWYKELIIKFTVSLAVCQINVYNTFSKSYSTLSDTIRKSGERMDDNKLLSTLSQTTNNNELLYMKQTASNN